MKLVLLAILLLGALRDPLRTHSTAGSGVLQAWDVDPSDAWPDLLGHDPEFWRSSRTAPSLPRELLRCVCARPPKGTTSRQSAI